MAQPIRSSLFLLVVGCVFLAVSCDQSTHLQSTVPSQGATGMDPRTIIAVEISNTILDSDEAAVDPNNFRVTGDLTQEPYRGTVSLARRKRLWEGMTIEQFVLQQQEQPPVEGEEDTSDDDPKYNTMVWLLETGVEFKAGEWIKVAVDSKVTARGTPAISSKVWWFQIEKGEGAEGDLRVTSASPSPGRVQVPNRPRVQGSFNRAVDENELEQGITLRGSQSGVHSDGVNVPTRTEGATRVLEVLHLLADDDAFLPGETVEVTFSSSITEAGTSQSPAPTRLMSYLAGFQVESGLVMGGWTAADVAGEVTSPIAILAADFKPLVPGVEIAVVGEDRLAVLDGLLEPSPSRTLADIPLQDPEDTFRVVDAAVYDIESDGIPEIIVMLEGAGGSRLEFFELDLLGGLTLREDPVDFPPTGLGEMSLADLDANGKPEILVSHPSSRYSPGPGQPLLNTGFLTLFELALVDPDPDDINLGDPDSLLPTLRFTSVATGLADLPKASRIGAVDLTGDGKLELLFETAGGLKIQRNIGTPGVPFAFRTPQGVLAGRRGGVVRPLAWATGDLDNDGDFDIIAWDAEGPLLYENLPEAPDSTAIATDPTLINSVWRPIELGSDMLDFVLAESATAHVLELDGDGVQDLVVSSDASPLVILRGRPGTPFAFDRLPLDGAAVGERVAMADVNGDTGLDLVSIMAGSDTLRVISSQGVEAPTPVVPSTFEFASEESGLTDLDGETIRVAVVGNIEEPFSGYSVAIEYDETVLDYKGFETPPALATHEFTPCPNAQLLGCSGFATVRMSYRQGQGGKAAGVLLGTFLFEKPEVTEPTVTEIKLESVDGANDTRFENTLTLAEGDATFESPVTIQGGPVVLTLEPPAPPSLAVECSVLERVDDTLTGLVTWTSPAEVEFSRLEISVGGGVPETVPGTETEHVFTTSLAGIVDVTVTGFPTSGDPVDASCNVVGIHRPSVTCVAVSETENVVNWTISHNVESFVVYRNGEPRQTVNGAARQYSDKAPSTTGADNYEVAGVINGIEGPRGSCEGGPVGDPDDASTEPPTIRDAMLLPRAASSDPNVLRLRWTNGEGYDSISVSLTREGDSTPFFSKDDLPGSRIEFEYDGDLDVGGVTPEKYIFSISGSTNLRESSIVQSSAVSVPVPGLAVNLTCSVDGDGRVVASWDKPWQGYSLLELFVEQTIDGSLVGVPERIVLDMQSTSYVLADISPVGVYTLRLVATYDDPSLPGDLLPPAAALSQTCSLRFDPRVLVEDVEAGVGRSDVEIPVEAEVLGEVEGFRFELEVPSFLAIDEDPVRGLRLAYGSVSNVKEFRIESDVSPGRSRVVVELEGLAIPPDADGDGVADARKVLVSLLGSLPVDFTLPKEAPLAFSASTSLRFQGQASVLVDTEDGTLLVRHRFLALDTVDVAAGSQAIVPMTVRATFPAPPSMPEYRLNAFQLHLRWDPKLIELQPVTEADQAGTVVADVGSYILPTEAAYEAARITGDLKVSWLGFDFMDPSNPQFLYPGVDMELLRIRLRSLVPGDSPGTLAKVEFVTDLSEDLPTAIFPEVDDPTEPDLEGFFDGGLRILPQDLPFRIDSISPAKGPLIGGTVTELRGTGLAPPGTGPDGVTIRLRGGSVGSSAVDVTVDAADILAVAHDHIRFVVPPSALPSPSRSTVVDVELTTPSGSGTLSNAYTYEYPQLFGFDPSSGSAGGGELLVLLGEGLPVSSTVTFEVGAVTRAAPVTGAEQDGTRLQVTTPDLIEFENQRATIRVEVPGVSGTFVAPGTYLILPDSGGPTLEIDTVIPSSGTICGGLEVTITGQGFLSNLTVEFGTYPAASVQVLDARTARVITPSVPEGTGRVDVDVSTGPTQVARKADAFDFLHPAPSFIRGDANQDSSVNVSDAILIAELALGTLGANAPLNLDAADVNDDGVINGGDVTVLMAHLFGAGEPIPPPFDAPGLDPTPDAITSCPP